MKYIPKLCVASLILLAFIVGSSLGTLAAEPQYGGVLRIADNKLQPSLDPHHAMGFGGFELYLAFNTLIDYNQDLEFVPELAVSWEIPDSTTYIFHLRKGVQFHDGAEFNAEAVKWNFERMLSDYSQVKAFFKEVDKVEVLDEYTVRISLKKPFAPFLDSLASAGWMVSPAAVEKFGNDGFQKHPVGTGPFKFVNWDTQNGELVFARNEKYWDEGKPYLDQIVLVEIPEPQTRVFALQAGRVDYAEPIPASSVDQLEAAANLAVVPILAKSNTIDYLTFNCAKEPFNDKRVRLAVAYALDEEKILAFLPHTEPIPGPLPAASWGMSPNAKEAGYDPAKARELLREAGYLDGFEVTLKIWSNDPQQENLAVIVKQMLAEVGIKVSVEVLEPSTLFQQMAKGEFSLASLHWGGGGCLDPNGNLHALYSSQGQINWVCNYNNPEVDKLLQQALEMIDREGRKELYWKATELIVADHPMIWFGRFQSYLAHAKKVKGVSPLRPNGYFPIYENLWIQQ